MWDVMSRAILLAMICGGEPIMGGTFRSSGLRIRLSLSRLRETQVLRGAAWLLRSLHLLQITFKPVRKRNCKGEAV